MEISLENVYVHIGAERVNDSNSCKLNLIQISPCGRCKKQRGGEEKGEEYFPHYPPPPCFSPLLKSTIPFDA